MKPINSSVRLTDRTTLYIILNFYVPRLDDFKILMIDISTTVLPTGSAIKRSFGYNSNRIRKNDLMFSFIFFFVALGIHSLDEPIPNL